MVNFSPKKMVLVNLQVVEMLTLLGGFAIYPLFLQQESHADHVNWVAEDFNELSFLVSLLPKNRFYIISSCITKGSLELGANLVGVTHLCLS